MRSLLRWLQALYSGPFQAALVFSFTLVAALTIGLGSWVISRTVADYLEDAMEERVEQDLQSARMFYETKLAALQHTANQLALSNTVLQAFESASRGEEGASARIAEKCLTAIDDEALEGNLTAAVLDREGNLIGGAVIRGMGDSQVITPGRTWLALEPAAAALKNAARVSGTAILPLAVLEDTGLADQAGIEIVDTPQAVPDPYDPREGKEGLGIVAVSPVHSQDELLGVVVVFHLFNNDFTLVDAIKDSTRVDTVTIFFGDLRISTNVMTEEGQRAVGTRVSKEVNQVVLQRGEGYVGEAFVVNQFYITRYEPLRDFRGTVVGILYVGARQQAFNDFLNSFRQRVALVSGITIVLTFVLATPVSRVITQPLKDLQSLAETSRMVAEGDLDARAPTTARGEVGQLAASFNEMLDALQAAQKRLLQTEQLASLGQLAAGVAHELNNPLATVLLFSELLGQENDLPEQVQRDLETIIRETERCKKIVSSLLDFARQNQVESDQINLNELIQQVVETESRQPRYQKAKFVLDLDPDLPLIQADPGQLQAALSNLISNAADAMPEGGRITLRTRPAGRGRVSVEIEDEGVGISREHQEKIYTPFFSTKPPGKGTGLGLSIVYGIVKMHQGDIRVRSELGKGTVFTLELPVRLPITPVPDRPELDAWQDMVG